METWPEALKVAYDIIMSSRFPMFVWWGPDLINFYNEAYAPMLGKRHPAAFGRPASEVWYEIWDVVGKQADLVVRQRQSTWNEEMLLLMERYGYIEETYFTWSYSPIGSGDGSAAGLFCAVTEDTSKVIGRRRLRTLRELASEMADLQSAGNVFTTAVRVLERNPHDIPFALLYEIDPDGKRAKLAGAAGCGDHGSGAAREVGLAPEENPWGLDLRSGEARVVDSLDCLFDQIPQGPWPHKPNQALVLPFRKAAEGQTDGFIVAGISSYRELDDEYRGFLALAAGHIATALSNSRAYEAERRRAEALAEIDRAKTVFFSNVSHEFRTPLTLLLGPLEDALANRQGIISMGLAASLATAHRNALRLLKLVNTLLDFSRIEAGRAKACYRPVDLPALTAGLASNFSSLCDEAGLTLTVDCPPLQTPESAFVDRDMWEKIVLNLLSNAFKFTLQGEIEVKLRARGGNAVLTVRDTGVGIPASELPHMFDRFHRVEQNRGRTQEGTGIGLALVQELVKLHQGTVAIESAAGKGSTFTVSIPLGKEHLNPDQLAPAEPDAVPSLTPMAFLEEASVWLPGEPAVAPREPDLAAEAEAAKGDHLESAPDAAARAQAKPRLLWADDNADMRAYVSRLLSGRFTVEAVTDGQAALEAARAREPDLILADVMMPGLDGFGLLRELRADPELSAIPVILLSARAGEEARIEGLQAGADDYLTKPFGARELRALLESQLKLARFRRDTTHALKQASRHAALLASIVDSSDDAIISKDLNGIITSWNLGAQRLFGYTATEAIGQSITILIPEERLGEEAEILARLRRGERVHHFETVRRRKDGALLDISLTISPVADEQGKIVGASKIARDITQRKRAEAELRRVNQDLKQFAYSASHDLREPLRSIKIYGELLAESCRDRIQGNERKFLDFIRNGATRMESLVRDLLAYTEIANADLKDETSDAHDLLVLVLDDLHGAIEESGARVTADPLPKVRIQHTHLRLLFQNLISNAIKYRVPDRLPVIHISSIRRGDYWEFSVHDNGIGIEPQYQDRIFGVFERLHTQEEYSGTGIGLAICQRIVQRSQGRIWVESEPGKGSTFHFTLPKAAADAAVS